VTAPFCMFLLVVGTGLSFLYHSAWPVGIAFAVLVCNWKFWRNQ
jgi:hypothetical protein